MQQQADIAKERYGSFVGNRWVQLIAGIIAMIVISNYQYAFTLFSTGIARDMSISIVAVAAIFSLFITFETWPTMVAGYFIDRFGIRNLMLLGGAMIALGWIGSAFATSVTQLYALYGVVAGIGAGIIYISCSANAVKWFPDWRGMAVGLTAAGFGGGAALTLIPISLEIAAAGWRQTFLIFGILQGIIAIIMALILRHPPAGWRPAKWAAQEKAVSERVTQTTVSYGWHKMLARPEFWVIYAMFTMTATGGLMATGNLAQIAASFGLSKVTLLGIGVVALAATINGVTNAVSRPLWGLVSDRIGREYTMAAVFLLEAFLVFLVTTSLTSNPIVFVLLLGMAFLAWGEIFSLYPSVIGDAFGPKYATANYGITYSAKGVASWLAGVGAAAIAVAYKSWIPSLYVAVVLDVITAFLAIFVLRGMVKRRVIREVSAAAATGP